MDIVQFCEAAMMVAFGCSWPLNIVKSLQSRTAKGKSVQFEIIVVLGYMVGLAGKIVSWQRTGVLAYSVWFYILNMVMVSIDIVLYFRNSALDREREQAREQRERTAETEGSKDRSSNKDGRDRRVVSIYHIT